MNQQVGTGALAAIIVIVILGLGIIGWRVFAPHGSGAQEQQQQRQQILQDEMRLRSGARVPGAPVAPMPGGARPGGP